MFILLSRKDDPPKIQKHLIYRQHPLKPDCPQVQKADPISLGNDFRLFPGTCWWIKKCGYIGKYINTNNSFSLQESSEK